MVSENLEEKPPPMDQPTPPPPRHASSKYPRGTSSFSLSSSSSSLQTLLQMGFKRSRAEKSLVATGHRGVQIASDWLLSHVNDPHLDDPTPRKFVLYLCPVKGCPFYDKLQTFWDATRTQIGRNGVHDSFPHITLSNAFSIPYSKVQEAISIIKRVMKTFSKDFINTIKAWKFEKYTSNNFFGLFVAKNEEILLRSFTQELNALLNTKLGGVVTLAPVSSGFHISLAYQFAPKHSSGLEDLLIASDLEYSSNDVWEVRLYSYDPQLSSEHSVYKVVYPLVPREDDELPLLSGDYVYIVSSDYASSPDGWVTGISWLTGCTGYLPQNYVQRTLDSNAWTLHLALKFEDCDSKNANNNESNDDEIKEEKENIVNKSSACSSSSFYSPSSNTRQIYIVRHGERVDFTFGTWIPYCFDSSGHYSRKDLNLPLSLPNRSKGPEGFARDCPLTCFGELQATMTGQAMNQAGVSIKHVYCSPSLRCVQTCHNILRGLGSTHLKIHIEPGLFEWLAWYQDGNMPDWMSAEELIQAGFNIETDYKPYISADELQDVQESCEHFYVRNCFVTQCVLQATEETGGNLLLVGHAATLDACSRQLVGGESRTVAEMMNIVKKVSYCGVALATQVPVEDPSSPPKWKLEKPPFPAMTHCSNNRFDWNILNETK